LDVNQSLISFEHVGINLKVEVKMEKKLGYEVEKLDDVYNEIVEAILNKPETQDYENSRIYFENVATRMNQWAIEIKDVKKKLEEKEPIADLTADNRPA